jgi:DNA-binding MltR family transcriptional regulator
MTDLAKDMTNLIDAIQRQDRMTHSGVVIAATAILDNQLERSLKRAMRPMSKSMYEKLFGAFRPLNTFSSKIAMAYALSIINKDVYNELEKIRKIRNEFAHSSAVLHFGSFVIAPLLGRLKRSPSKATKPARVFLECVKAIEAALEEYLRGTRFP